jgi:hypothetical protein
LGNCTPKKNCREIAAEKELVIAGTSGFIKEKLNSIYEESGISEFIIHDKLTDLKKRKKAWNYWPKNSSFFNFY